MRHSLPRVCAFEHMSARESVSLPGDRLDAVALESAACGDFLWIAPATTSAMSTSREVRWAAGGLEPSLMVECHIEQRRVLMGQ
jgi:hypothetical protein